jgi:hypothetical protein
MILLETKKRHIIYWALVLCFTATTKFSLMSDLRISLDAIFSGLLALTGFVFTARTFITFKLNEVIYGSSQYRDYVEKLQKEGAYKQLLYDPLRNIDNKLGTATYMCLCSIIMFVIVAFLPKAASIKLGSNQVAEYIYQLFLYTDITSIFTAVNYILPLIYKLITDIALVYFGFCIYQMVIAAKALHQNISDIVRHWEEDYKESKSPE